MVRTLIKGVLGKKCSTCGQWKPLEEFPKDRTHGSLQGGRHCQCKQCHAEKRHEKHKNNDLESQNIKGQKSSAKSSAYAKQMIVTAWNNSSHHASGGGYGIKIIDTDRQTYFKSNWITAKISLPNGVVFDGNIAKKSFWKQTCGEIINKEIGKWMLITKLAPWPKGQPPKMTLTPLGGNRFKLK